MTNYKSIFKKLCKNIQQNDNTVTFSSNYHPDIEDYTDDEGNDLFHLASANGREQIVRFLAPLASISIDKTNNNGWTPLMQASRNGHLSIVLFLLSRGADPNKSTNFGMNSMVLAVKSGNFQVVKALLNNGYDSRICPATISPEMMAVSMGRDDILSELVNNSKLKNSKKSQDMMEPGNTDNLDNSKNSTQVLIRCFQQTILFYLRKNSTYWRKPALKDGATTFSIPRRPFRVLCVLNHFYRNWGDFHH